MEEKCLPPDHPRFVKHLEWIARIYNKKNDYEKVLTLNQEKLAAQPKIPNENQRSSYTLYRML